MPPSLLEAQLRKSLAIEAAVRDARMELVRAIGIHPQFHSAHEGHSVVREEFEELWREVMRRDRDQVAMRAEAVQLAAMALRFIVDVCCDGH